MQNVPLPPVELIERVGAVADAVGQYVAIGEHQLAVLEHYLGSLDGLSFLDWGCGAGRLLRLIGPTTELYGVELDTVSIDWMAEHLPHVHGMTVTGPRIPLPDESIDVVAGLSVMTHIADDWAAWLLEIRRILKPGGQAVFTKIGALTAPLLTDRWDEDRVGMLVLRYSRPFAVGGPDVVHSDWWVREHWGRAFEIVSIEPDPLLPEPGQHDYAMLRKPALPAPSAFELEEPGDDHRELAGLVTALAEARAELAVVAETASRTAAAEQLVESMEATVSWRLTKPLRALRSSW